MSPCLLLDVLPVYVALDDFAPPANAVLLVAAPGEVFLVKTQAADCGWVYQEVPSLLRRIHREQWLLKRGPVYLRPAGHDNFYKAYLHPPE